MEKDYPILFVKNMSVVVARLVMQFAPLGQLVCNLMKKVFFILLWIKKSV